MSAFKAGKTGDTAPAGKVATISNQGPGAKSAGDKAGVEYGLSSRMSMDVNENEPDLDYARDPLTGNATERPKPRTYDSVSAKGKSFQIES